MPKPQTINNPDDAHVTVSDYQTGLDDSGGELALGNEIETFVASGTISKGDAVAISGASDASTKPAVDAVGTAGPGYPFVGIARHDALADELVEVVVRGFALGAVVAGVALDDALTFSGTTAGALDTATLDATFVVGDKFGIALAVTQDPALTPVFVMHM